MSTILLVDDDVEINNCIGEMLRGIDFICETGGSGCEEKEQRG